MLETGRILVPPRSYIRQSSALKGDSSSFAHPADHSAPLLRAAHLRLLVDTRKFSILLERNHFINKIFATEHTQQMQMTT